MHRMYRIYSIKIKNSYTVWRPQRMKRLIYNATKEKYDIGFPTVLLNRSYEGMYFEWWLHNIGYYITLPFIFIPCIKKLNLRFKDVDLEENDSWFPRP